MTAPAETELAEEISQHLEDRYRELRAGTSDEDACRRVMAELDDIERLRAGIARHQRAPRFDVVPSGDARRGNAVGDLGRDLRYALRTMRKSPLFVLFVVGTLALGIGANTTVFTLINTLILNPLPVRNASELMGLSATDTATSTNSVTSFPLSYADLKDYESANAVFGSFAGYSSPRGVTWQQEAASEGMFAELVTANYFPALGLAPSRGRFFLPEEDATRGTHAVAVMNYGTWKTRFGGDDHVIGRTLRINNVVFTIVGVAPPGFIGVNAIFGPDLWIPSAMAERIYPTDLQNAWTDRKKALFLGAGRLKPGVTVSQAQANLSAIAAGLANTYVADQGHTVAVRPLRDAVFVSSFGASGPVLFASAALLIVVGIVLLIACSNVANLMLARSAARRQEMAVRLAMGASRSRLVRQLLTESTLLGLLSGLSGLLVAYAGVQLLFSALPSAGNFVVPKIDTVVLGFTLLVSVATGFLFGALPAFRASRASVAETLKEDARTAGRSRKRITVANTLLVAQVAFSFVLLVTAAMFLRSIQRAYQIDPGFQTAHLAVFPTNPGQAGYRAAQTAAFYKDVRERVEQFHGIESVSWSSSMPLWTHAVGGLEVEGREQRSRADTIRSVVVTVDQGYFRTAGISLVNGRDFSNADQPASTPVAIVNEKAAHDYWPGGALGRRVQLPGEKEMRQIVGVASTATYSTWGEAPQSCVYVPLEQNSNTASMVLYVRTAGDPREILLDVERAVRSAGPQVLIFGQRTGAQIIDNGLFQAKLGVVLLTVFGLLALGLASVGLYGIVAYSVSQRRREIGLRLALGATQSDVLGLVLRQGMSLVLMGVAIGFAVSLLAGRLLSRMLYGVAVGDPLSVTGAAVLLSAVALLACYLPARGASRVDPLRALHQA